MKNQIPYLGVGLSYRSNIHDEIIRNRERLDFLEVIPDQFIYSNEQSVASILADLKDFPLMSHSVNLSIGTDAEIDRNYLKKVIEFVKRTDSLSYSEHICFTRVPGIDLGQLSPLQFTREMVEVVCRNVDMVMDSLEGIPFYLENISYYLDVPGAEMSEPEFLSRIIERSGCGMLLDINNLFVNSINRKYNPYLFLEQIPLDRVEIIHIAGHKRQGGIVLDSHDGPSSSEVWRLLEYVLNKTEVKAVLFEQDENLENFDTILKQVIKARQIFNDSRKTKPRFVELSAVCV
jgi:uncharacterized protein (UPF0276 family)